MKATLLCATALSEENQCWLRSRRQLQLTDEPTDWVLKPNESGLLQLSHAAEQVRGPLVVDFLHPKVKHKMKSIRSGRQPLIRAMGKTSEAFTVWDLTAGLGGDAVVLANAGHAVNGFEKNPVLYLMLNTALKVWQDSEPDHPIHQKKLLKFTYGDSIEILKSHPSQGPDSIYIDPMFPAKKKGRLSQGPMQWVQSLLSGENSDIQQLLSLALEVAHNRVVIKRGLKAETIEGPLQFSYKGTSVRYDMYKKRLDLNQ